MIQFNSQNTAPKSTNLNVNFIAHSSNLDSSAVQKKMLHSKTNKFASSLRPMYSFSRCFGLLPYSIVINSNGDIQGTKLGAFNLLWFIISVCFYLILAYVCYRDIGSVQHFRNRSESYAVVLGDYLILIQGLIYCALVIIFDMINRFKLISILKDFADFDNEVRYLAIS